jgi:hypothetical protein
MFLKDALGGIFEVGARYRTCGEHTIARKRLVGYFRTPWVDILSNTSVVLCTTGPLSRSIPRF